MSAFERYARWYDLLYGDKNYEDETTFVIDQLRRNGAHAGSLLDLGCGTGVHASAFARLGWNVTGVDLSEDMILHAQKRLEQERLSVEFRQGDVCQNGPEREFDVVVSLFHVASYQTNQSRLEDMLRTAYTALKPGGVLLFDYWYGGAVLAQGVETRVKVVTRDNLSVTRIAQPKINEETATVCVNYTLFCEDSSASEIQRMNESHYLRYWFPFEIEEALRVVGLESVGHYAWLSNDKPNSSSWAAYSVAKRP